MDNILRELNHHAHAETLAPHLVALPPTSPPWYHTIPADSSRPPLRALPTAEECQPITPEQLESAYQALRNQIPGYETRPGQTTLLYAVADAFNTQTHLLAEAGTGTGKTLAYLLPAALYAHTNDIPIVISTNTKNLQSQILQKDLPHVQAALQAAAPGAAPLATALLKGRGNYICLRRFGALLKNQHTLAPRQLFTLLTYILWLAQTPDGDLETYDPNQHAAILPKPSTDSDATLAPQIQSIAEECAGRACPYCKRCYLQKARRRASQAHLIITNHALLFADIQNGGALPPHHHLILDEAHNLEEAVTRHYAKQHTPQALQHILRRLTTPKHNDYLNSLQTQHPELAETIQTLRQTLDPLIHTGQAHNAYTLELMKGHDALRYTLAPGNLLQLHHGNAPSVLSSKQQDNLNTLTNEYVQHSQKVHQTLNALVQALEPPEGMLPLHLDQQLHLTATAQQLSQHTADFLALQTPDDPNQVYWLERHLHHGHKPMAGWNAAPLNIAPCLHHTLYTPKASVIHTSATLRVGSSYTHTLRRLGLDHPQARTRTHTAPSPFNYTLQCQAYALTYLPDPTGSTAGDVTYAQQLARVIHQAARHYGGHTLVLFTSYTQMNATAQQLTPLAQPDNLTLLIQGQDQTREQITHTFRNTPRTILLGTQSFWEGLDLIGHALQCVIVARLPFTPPDDPINQARCQQIDQAGGSSFRDHTLPMAAIKLKQGFGRLIRSQTDTGTLIIADPRLTTKNYGKTLLRSLPLSVHTIDSLQALQKALPAQSN